MRIMFVSFKKKGLKNWKMLGNFGILMNLLVGLVSFKQNERSTVYTNVNLKRTKRNHCNLEQVA